MPSMDVFNTDPFSLISLTAAVNEVPFVPGRLGQLGLFEEQGVTTTTIAIERIGETLSLVPVTPRGGVPTPNSPPKSKMHLLSTVRLAMEDRIYADEVQNVRAFGTESDVRTVEGLTNQRNAQMARKLDATLEFHRTGAIKGIIYDADGYSVLWNLFTEFGVSQQTEIDFDLDAATPASGAVMAKANQVLRLIEDELGGAPYTEIRAVCSSQFFDALVTHKEVRETYQAENAVRNRERTARREIFYGGIYWEEYRGKVGTTAFVADDKAHVFPVGVPGLFITRYAPADYEETVNTMGLPRYARQAPDPSGFNRFRQLEVQSNPINLCTRPRVLIPLRRT